VTVLRIYVFGSESNGNVYKYNTKNRIFEKNNNYQNNFTPDDHNVISYRHNNTFFTLSCGGYGNDNQHLHIFNHALNTWNTNIKYNKKKFCINYGSQSAFINIKNTKHIIKSTMDANYKNCFLIFDINKLQFINKLERPKEFDNITFSYHTFIKYSLLENKYIIMYGNKIIYFSINDDYNINIIKIIDNNTLDYDYLGMSYLNINNNYIITFGGYSDKHSNNIYILDIKNEIFYQSNIKLKYRMCNSGCFLENNRIIHIFGGRSTKRHYTIALDNILCGDLIQLTRK